MADGFTPVFEDDIEIAQFSLLYLAAKLEQKTQWISGLNSDSSTPWQTKASDGHPYSIALPSKVELKSMLESLEDAVARSKSWAPEDTETKLKSVAKRQLSLLTQAMRINARDMALNEAKELLDVSKDNASKLRSIMKKLSDDPQYSMSAKRKLDTEELLKGAEEALERCKRLKAQEDEGDEAVTAESVTLGGDTAEYESDRTELG
ncbi:hypothetical protein OHC33_000213 [Knufia fluminis]|uniref:Uncharacterized protein n=1 Tax=Knufia fluminis TaxID=191047 RepID=A0AAN8ICF3_9EURO|nr:hypothetical protein OHC33_000213 [Knufia fluminis]